MKRLLLFLFFSIAVFGQTQVPINSGVVTISTDQGQRYFKVVLNQNVTSFSFTGTPVTPGAIVTVLFTQDSVGGRTVSGFASNINNPCSISGTSANATTTCQFTFDSTTNTWQGIVGGGGTSDPPVTNSYSLTSVGAQASINLTAAPIDTHTISWRLASNTVITDSIPYANGDLHTANSNWVYQTGTLTVSSNTVYGNAANSLAYRSDGANTGSEFSQETVTVTVASGTQNNGPCVRIQTATYSGYCARVATNLFDIAVFNSGTPTSLAAFAAQNPSTGDVVRLSMVGTTLSLYRNGVLVGTATDSTYASGFTGAYSAGNATSNGFTKFQSSAVCNVALDSSPDGVTWTAGGMIPSQSCDVTPSSSFQGTGVANFVRVNAVAIPPSSTLTVVYSGRLGPSPSTGNSAVSNGQWANAGEVVWTQITGQNVGTVSVSTNIRISFLNSTTSTVLTVPACGITGPGGFGFGYTVPSSGWLQSVTSQINTGGFPQGTFYINQYLLGAMPSGGTNNTCTSSFALYGPITPTLLSSGAVGSFFPVSFVGTTGIPQSPWAIPGFTTTLTQANPSAGAEFSFTAPTAARVCVQSVSFTLAAGSTNVNPTIVFTINGSKIAYTAATAQTSATTQNYSFSPGATAEAVTAGATVFHIVPFNNGQLACFNSGLSAGTITSVTTGLNGTTQYSNISFLVQLQQDND